jgi:hypothetical protein
MPAGGSKFLASHFRIPLIITLILLINPVCLALPANRAHMKAKNKDP